MDGGGREKENEIARQGVRRCKQCGAPDTGWRPTTRDGATICPACAQGVARVPVEEMLSHRRALLKRLEAEGDAHPGVARFRDEVKNDVKRLERRQHETAESEKGADA